MASTEWPPFTQETKRAEVMLKNYAMAHRDVAFNIPPKIASCPLPQMSAEVSDIMDEALALLPKRRTPGEHALGERNSDRKASSEITSDRKTSSGITPDEISDIMEGLLLRTEAINSSRIERYLTHYRNLALAQAGASSKPGAKETQKNAAGLSGIFSGDSHGVSIEAVLSDHRRIMEGEHYAGRFRVGDEYVYFGSGSMLEADYVAPLSHSVEELMRDWAEFATRSEDDIIAHIAVAHLQFEVIHPFCDGNGRTGRAAMQRMLLSSGRRAVPVSAALYAKQQSYYDTFQTYREGNLEYPIFLHAAAFWAVAKSVTDHQDALDLLLAKWRNAADAAGVGDDRKSYDNALKWICQNPAFTQDMLAAAIDVGGNTAAQIIENLASAKIIVPGKRTRIAGGEGGKIRQLIWEAKEIYALAESVEKSTQELVRSRAR